MSDLTSEQHQIIWDLLGEPDEDDDLTMHLAAHLSASSSFVAKLPVEVPANKPDVLLQTVLRKL